jgi:hypothetical protein
MLLVTSSLVRSRTASPGTSLGARSCNRLRAAAGASESAGERPVERRHDCGSATPEEGPATTTLCQQTGIVPSAGASRREAKADRRGNRELQRSRRLAVGGAPDATPLSRLERGGERSHMLAFAEPVGQSTRSRSRAAVDPATSGGPLTSPDFDAAAELGGVVGAVARIADRDIAAMRATGGAGSGDGR